MAFKTKVLNESIRNIFLILIALRLVASSNIDCGGKAFHCVNSTHFMICVDLGGGVTSTIDGFIISCPPSTECQGTNFFECEYLQPTSVSSLTETSVPSELRLSEITTAADTNIISTIANRIISEVQSTEINLNSITTLQEDSVTTNKPVTESVVVESIATADYTNIGYTLTTAPNDFTTNTNTIDTSTFTPSDIGNSVAKTSTPLYQDTLPIFTTKNETVTSDPNIIENIEPTNKSLLDYTAAITETSVPIELRLSEITTAADTNIISTIANRIISEVQSTDINLNTVSITTLQEDSVTTNKPVTESVVVESIATADYTNIGYTLTTAPNDFTTNTNTIDTSTFTPSDIGNSVAKTSIPLYQDTLPIFTTKNVTDTSDLNIIENIEATDKSLLAYTAAITNNEIDPDQNATKTPETSTSVYQDTVMMLITKNTTVTTDQNILEIIGTTYKTLLDNSTAKTINETVPDQNATKITETSTPLYQDTVATLITMNSTVTTDTNILDIIGTTDNTLLNNSTNITINETVLDPSVSKTAVTATPLYQDTVAISIIDDVYVKTFPIILENIGATDKSLLDHSRVITTNEPLSDQSATTKVTLNDTFNSFSTEKDNTIKNIFLSSNESSLLESKLSIADITFNNAQYQTTTKEIIDTTVGTTTTVANIDIISTDTVLTETFREKLTTESNQLFNEETLEFTTRFLTEVTIGNKNISEVFVTTDGLQMSDLSVNLTSEISVTEQNESSSEPIQIILNTKISPNIANIHTNVSKFDNADTAELPFVDNSGIQNNVENKTTVAETTYDTTNTITITQDHQTTESILQATTITNNININKENVFSTSTIDSSIFTVDAANTLNQETSTLVGLTTVTTESNMPKDRTTLVSVTEPLTTLSQFMINETNDKIPKTSFSIESSTNSVTSDDIIPIVTRQTQNSFYTVPNENNISSIELVAVNTSNTIEITISEVNIINTISTKPDFEKTTVEGTLNKSSVDAKVKDVMQSTERYKNSFTGFTEGMFDEYVPTVSSLSGSEIFDSAKEITVGENSTKSLNVKTKSTDTNQNVVKPSKYSTSPPFVIESYKMAGTSPTFKNTTNSLSVNDQDPTIIAAVTDILIKNNQHISTIEFYPESTTKPSVDNLEVTIVGDNDISTPVINVLNGKVEKMTAEIHNYDQKLTSDILSNANGLNDTLQDNVTDSTFEDTISSINNFSTTDNNYQVESETEEITQFFTNSDVINKKDYDIGTTLETQVFKPNLNQTSAHTGANEAIATEISIHALPLNTDNVISITQKSIVNSENSQSTATMNPFLRPFFDVAKLTVEAERTIDETMSNYSSYLPAVKKATNTLLNNYDDSKTIKPLILTDVFPNTSDFNKNTQNKVFLQNNTFFKPGAIVSTQSIDNLKNYSGDTLKQQITNYDLSAVILSKTELYTKHDTRNISDQLETLLTPTESTIDGENISKLNVNIILKTKTLNTDKMVGDLTISANNQSKDSLTAQNIDVASVVGSTLTENIKTVDNKNEASTTRNVTTAEKNGSSYDAMKEDVNSNFRLQFHNSFYNNEEKNLDANLPELLKIANKEIIHDMNKTTNDSINKGFQKVLDLSANQVANEYKPNEYNIDNVNLAGRIKDEVSLYYSQNNTQHNGSSVVSKQHIFENQINARNVTKNILENSASNQFLSPHENVGQNLEASIVSEIVNNMVSSDETNATLSTIGGSLNQPKALDQEPGQNTVVSLINANTVKNTSVSFNETTFPSASNNVSLIYATVLGEKLAPNAEASKTNTINKKDVSSGDLQATSMPNNGIKRQSLALDQKLSQNVEGKETNTLNNLLVTNSVNETGVSSIDAKASVIPYEGSLKQPLTYDKKLVENRDSNFTRSVVKPEEEINVAQNKNLPTDPTLPEFPKDNIAIEQKTLHQSTAAVYTTVGVTTTVSTESPVNPKSINDSTNRIINSQKVINPFCFTRNRGRYADREDCTKFYICIGKIEPIVGKCPANTVFSEIKKQCTKNKSHCVRGNEFKCLSEGRFSDVFKKNAYYICIKRQNTFIRFKFQCQNGHYLNKLTVRCTKQLDTVNQSSTSVDNSNSEKSGSEGMSTQNTNKNKNNKDSQKESKSGEEFECKKEGKFADPDNCRKFYVCTKTKKSEFRLRKRSCDSDEVFHKNKKKCVDDDSYEC